MAGALTEAETTELKKLFAKFDKDGSGFISEQELKEGVEAIKGKISDEEIKKIIKEADLNGDGKINYEEFIKLMKNGYLK